MAYKRVILESAQADRDGIIKHLTEVTGGLSAAAAFLADLDNVVNLASELPTLFALSRFGALASQGFRTALVGSYVMLYRSEDDTVYIAHIFHQRQDYASLV